ncbi:class I SAM-dependent methyltransferase [Natronomonas sp. LN261]|jgi:SAM-dependent methyltransferase|uniref:class I SAM-dependent methyltransferase n=1 Tax=Natronomonas sp. LN261 TaxID=2750669 RepID=UPI0015EE7271
MERTTRRQELKQWDERFRSGSYPQDPDPSPLLRRYVGELPDGRALDIATGTGRNAVFLAASGYTVDAIDQSYEGLKIARENASRRGVESRINWIRADVSAHAFPTDRYALITVSFYRCLDRFADVKEALAPGGCVFVEHHLRSSDPTPGGASDDRYRYAANELLHSCLDLTVLHYDEAIERPSEGKGRATARLLARKSTGTRQPYPLRPQH